MNVICKYEYTHTNTMREREREREREITFFHCGLRVEALIEYR
jgi:hypothetical protein